MSDPKRVVSFEDMLEVIHEPKKVIIDVREPDEVASTGMIPSSINIPCNYYFFICLYIQFCLENHNKLKYQRLVETKQIQKLT